MVLKTRFKKIGYRNFWKFSAFVEYLKGVARKFKLKGQLKIIRTSTETLLCAIKSRNNGALKVMKPHDNLESGVSYDIRFPLGAVIVNR